MLTRLTRFTPALRPLVRTHVIKARAISFPWFHFIPHQQEWTTEQFGKYSSTLKPGFAFTLPFVQKISHKRGLYETRLPVSPQHAVTKDNVQVELDGVVYYRIVDTYKSCYEIDQPEEAIVNVAQAVMRKKVGTMDLDELFHNRDALNEAITLDLEDLKTNWGTEVTRYEIQDINMGGHTSEAM